MLCVRRNGPGLVRSADGNLCGCLIGAFGRGCGDPSDLVQASAVSKLASFVEAARLWVGAMVREYYPQNLPDLAKRQSSPSPPGSFVSRLQKTVQALLENLEFTLSYRHQSNGINAMSDWKRGQSACRKSDPASTVTAAKSADSVTRAPIDAVD
jgi:hypothetical protein